jgi:hypothetical protein
VGRYRRCPTRGRRHAGKSRFRHQINRRARSAAHRRSSTRTQTREWGGRAAPSASSGCPMGCPCYCRRTNPAYVRYAPTTAVMIVSTTGCDGKCRAPRNALQPAAGISSNAAPSIVISHRGATQPPEADYSRHCDPARPPARTRSMKRSVACPASTASNATIASRLVRARAEATRIAAVLPKTTL